MLPTTISNSTSLSEEPSVSSVTGLQDLGSLNPMFQPISSQQQQKIKKKRSLPGNPDPDAEVIALSPKDLLATNRFVCEICNKGFQRDQNLQLHRRGHNLPWKLRQRTSTETRKRVYVCPEPSCVHHHPSRALGDLTGIKKHFCRKHGEKKWKCEKCSRRYAVQSDWKAHSKTCGTREYRCDCGTLFARKDSFITHRAFCDALAEESARLSNNNIPLITNSNLKIHHHLLDDLHSQTPSSFFSSQEHHHHQQHFPACPPTHISLVTSSSDPSDHQNQLNSPTNPTQIDHNAFHQIPNIVPFFEEPPQKQSDNNSNITPANFLQQDLNISSMITHMTTHMSATALLQKAASVGAAALSGPPHSHSQGHLSSMSSMSQLQSGEFGKVSPAYMGLFNSDNLNTWQTRDHPTRDFLGLAREPASGGGGGSGSGSGNFGVRDMISFSSSEAMEFPLMYDRGHSLLRLPGFGLTQSGASAAETWGD